MTYFYDREKRSLVRLDEQDGLKAIVLEPCVGVEQVRYGLEPLVVGTSNIEKISKIQERVGKSAGGGKHTKVCKNCGEPGHMQKTCKAEKDQRSDQAPEEEGSAEVKRLIKHGMDDEAIAKESGRNVRVVAFIRKRMTQRGEI